MASHIPSYDGIRAKLELPETEETWDKISRGLDELKRLVRDDGSDQDPDFLPLLRTVARPLIDAMSSERTRLSGNAISTLSSIAAGLGRQFEPVVHIFFPPLLALCARANKITVSRARKAIADIIEGTLLPSLLTYFLDSSKDKSASLRLACAEGALGCLNSLNPPDLERESRVHQIEALIISAGGDASADVRQLSKKMYAAYCQLLPSRVDEFSSQLSPTIKKTLGVKQTVVAAASLAVPRPKSAAATLRASETKLSSSTSAVPSQRPQTSMSTHVRSASSSSEVTRGGAKPQGSMGPPNFIPSKPSQAPARPTHSRTASKVEEEGPKRPLSIHSVPSRPASASSTRSNGKEPNGTSSLNSSRSGPSRVKSRAIPPAEHDKIVSLARRVPLPDEDTQHHSLVDNAASSSSYSGPRRAPRKADSDQEAPSRQGMPGQRKPTVPVLEHAKAKEVTTAPKRTIAPVPVTSVAQPTQQPVVTARVTPVSKSATSATVTARTRTVSKPAPPSQKVASSEIIKTKVSTKPPVPKVADLKRTASKPALNSIGEGSKPTSKSRIPEGSKQTVTGTSKKNAVAKPAWGARSAAPPPAKKPGVKPSTSSSKIPAPKKGVALEAQVLPKSSGASQHLPEPENKEEMPVESEMVEHISESDDESAPASPTPEPSPARSSQNDEEEEADTTAVPTTKTAELTCPVDRVDTLVMEDNPTPPSALVTEPSPPVTPKASHGVTTPFPAPTPITQLLQSIEQGFIMDTPAPTPAPRASNVHDKPPVDPAQAFTMPSWMQFQGIREPFQQISSSNYLLSPVGPFPVSLDSPGMMEKLVQQRHKDAQNLPPHPGMTEPYELQSELSVAFEKFNPGMEQW